MYCKVTVRCKGAVGHKSGRQDGKKGKLRVQELYTRFDAVFFEKTRLSMMTVLYREGTVSFNRFKKIMGGTDGAVYSHAQKLLEAGYVSGKKEIAGNAVQTVYSLTQSGKQLFAEYLQFLENMLVDYKSAGHERENRKKNIRRKNARTKRN